MSPALNSLAPHFKALARIGFSPPLEPQGNILLKAAWHKVFRVLIFAVVIINMIQRAIYLCKVLGNAARMASCLYILLIVINGQVKLLFVNLRMNRIQALLDTMNGAYFQQTEHRQRQVNDNNARSVHRLFRVMTSTTLACAFLYNLLPCMDRLMGKRVEFELWMPFDALQSPVFEIVLIQDAVITTFQAYGHITMDCLICALFSQATTQMKILRHNFENIVRDAEDIMKNRGQQFSIGKQNAHHERVENQDMSKDNAHCSLPGVPQGPHYSGYTHRPVICNKLVEDKRVEGNINDEFEHVLIERFKFCVEHYRTIVSFIKEVDNIFNIALTYQGVIAAVIICAIMYDISEMDSYLTAQFAVTFSVLILMLTQLFMYCYHGAQLMAESEQLNYSIYSSDWTRTSVRFRKLLLIQMARGTRAIEPTVAYIVPLSLGTFIKVVKFSYSLFTVLRQE